MSGEVRKTGYLHELSVYAGLFGVSLRTVKRWAEKKAPFDAPEQMAAWWGRNMTQKIPDSISGMAVVSPPVVESVQERVPPRVVGEEEMGIKATQERLRSAEVLAHEKYLAAMEGNDAGQIRAALRNWSEISDQVRTISKVALDDELARKELIPRVQAEAALVEVHQPIMASFRMMFDDFSRLFGVARTTENETRWKDLVDGVCANLQKEVFGGSE